MNADGSFIVAWENTGDGDLTGVYAKRFLANGSDNGGTFLVNTTTSGTQTHAAVATLDANNYVITWSGQGIGDVDGVFARQDGTNSGIDLTSGLVLHLRLDEMSGTTAIDSSGNGNHATLGAASEQDWVSGPVDDAFHFNAGSGDPDYFEVPNSPTLEDVQESTQFTLAAWFNADNVPSGTAASDNSFAYGIVVKEGEHTGLWYTSTQQFKFEHWLSDGSYVLLTSTGTYPPGTFHHIAATVDHASGAAQLYIDGVLNNSVNFGVGKTSGEYGTETWKVGTAQDTFAAGDYAYPAQAIIDDVRIYERALDLADMQALAAMINLAPVANAGGPYTISEGGSVSLNASGSSDPENQPLNYYWDLNNNGLFGESGEPVTSTPTLSWSQLQAMGIDDNGIYDISVAVEDAGGRLSSATTTLTISNAAPALTVTGSSIVTVGQPYSLSLSASDPGADTISSWTINWGDGHIETVAGTASTVEHTYVNGGYTNSILVSATDEDGTWFTNQLITPSYNADRVFRFSAVTGTLSQQFGSNPTLNAPTSAVIGPDGLLYVSSESSNNVVRFNPATGALVDTFVAAGSGGLSEAAALAFGADGNLYVADYAANRILRFDGDTGAFLSVFVTAGSGGLTSPYSMTFGPDGHLYVGSYTGHSIRRYNGTTGQFIDTFVAGSTGGLNKPEGLLFGPDGHLYVTSFGTNTVLRFNGNSGALIDAFIPAGAGGLSNPTGLAFGPDGHLYVGDYADGAILRFDAATGQFIDEYVDGGTGGLTQPVSLTFLPNLQVTVNRPPVASAGGPYTINEGASLTVTAAGSSDLDGDALTFAWDLDDDNNYGESGEPIVATQTMDWATLRTLGITDDGVYNIRVRVTDEHGAISYAGVTVTVNNVAPTITSSSAVSVVENTLAVTTVTATDPNDTVSYQLTGGADQGVFSINSTSGQLTFTTAPDYEAPGDFDGDRVYEVQVAAIDSNGAVTNQLLLVTVTNTNDVAFQGSSTAIWAAKNIATPMTADYNGIEFSAETPAATATGTWVTMTGAESPTRSEKILLGVDGTGVISGQIWNGTTWSVLPFGTLATGAPTGQAGFAVAYESLSGRAIIVWRNGTTGSDSLSYRIWDGTAWTAAASVTMPASGAIDHLQLVAAPHSNEMTLVATTSDARDLAVVWDGSSWGNGVVLDGTTAPIHVTDASVAYEQQTGRAVAVWGTDSSVLNYRIWNGTTWSSTASWTPSPTITGNIQWTTLSADATSNRLAVGLRTDTGATLFAVWSGTAWTSGINVGSTESTLTFQGIAASFENESGQLVAAWTDNNNRIRFRTWNSTGGWSAQGDAVDVANKARSLSMTSRAGTDQIMLTALDDGADANFIMWDGASWGTKTELSADTGATTGTPLLFLWDDAPLVTHSPNSLLFTTGNDVNSDGASGLNTWTKSDVLSLSNPDLSLEPVNGQTSGTVQREFNLESFFGVNNAISGLHYVSRNLVIGSNNQALFAGDLLFTVDANTTLGVLTASNRDVILYRPSTPGDYSSGSYQLLLVSPTGSAIRGFSLIEQNTTVGDASLNAGDFLILSGNSNVMLYETGSVGLVTTGTTSVLLNGTDAGLGITKNLHGIELIETDTNIGGTTLSAGMLLLSVDKAGAVGSNALAVDKFDIFGLNVTRTTLGAGSADSLATATMIMQGADIGLNAGAEKINSIALLPTNSPPSAIQLVPNSIDEGVDTAAGMIAGVLATTDSDSGDRYTYTVVGGADAGKFTISGANGDRLVLSDGVLDYERQATYSVRVRSTDLGGAFVEELVTVTINDLNDESPVITSGLVLSVAENSSIGTLAGTVAASDADSSPVFSNWQITGGNTGGAFAINAATGVLTVANSAALNYEDQSSYALMITVSDGVHTSAAETVTVNLLNVEEPPVANDDSATTNVNTAVNINLTGNDSDPDGDALLLLDVNRPASGSVTDNGNGSVTYTPSTGTSGTDSFSYVVSDGTNGLTHYWNLNGDAQDAVGSADGTLNNGVSTIAGAYGTALAFDEVDDYVQIPDVAYTNEFTLSFKFRVDDNTGADFLYLYSHGNADTVNSLNVMIVESSRSVYPNNMKTIFTDIDDVYDLNALNFDASSIIGDGQWHTYTLTVSKAQGSRVYLDGVLKASDATRGGDAFDPAGDLFLGARQDLSNVRYFGGALDSVALYDHRLTPADVASLNTSQFLAAGTDTAMVTVAVADQPPVAATDGPYQVNRDGAVILDGSLSTDDTGISSYAWDLNDNGVFGETGELTAASGNITWATLTSLGISGTGNHNIHLRVTDTAGNTTTTDTILTVLADTTVNRNSTTDLQESPEVAMAADGSYVIVWQSLGQDSSGYGIYGQRYDAAGNRIGNEFRINTSVAGDQMGPKVAMDEAGNFVVTWNGQSLSSDPNAARDVFARVYAASGTPLSGEFVVNTTITGDQAGTSVAMDGQTGEFLIAWADERPDGTTDITGRRFALSGMPLSAEFQINTTSADHQRAPDVAVTGAGEYIVVWTGLAAEGDTSAEGNVYGQIFDQDLNRLGSEFRINTTTVGHQNRPAIAAGADGNFTVVWMSEGQDGSDSGIYGRHYSTLNSVSGGAEFRVNATTSLDQTQPGIAADRHGNVVITWQSKGQDGDGSTETNIYHAAYERSAAGLTQVVTETRTNTFVTADQRRSAVALRNDGTAIVTWDGNGPADPDGIYSIMLPGAVVSGAPVISMASAVGTYVENDAPLQLDSLLVVTDPDSTQLTSATVWIQKGFVSSEDRLTFTAVAGISGSYDATSGVLVLTGNASVGSYQTVLRSVAYYSTSENPATNQRIVGVTVSDGILTGTDFRRINVETGNDDAPIGVADSYTVDQGGTLNIGAASGVLRNDSDPELQPLAVTLVSGPSKAAAFNLNSDGSFTYQNNRNQGSGTDSFVYAVSDGTSSVQVTVTLTINHVNFAPDVVISSPGAIAEGGSVTLDATGTTDSNGDPLTYSWDLNGDGFYGDVTGQTVNLSWSQLSSFGINNGSATGTAYSIGLRVSDGNGGISTGSTSLTVLDTAPVVSVAGHAAVTAGETYTLTLSSTDPGAETITGWTVAWGDGAVDSFTGNPASVTHVYQNAGQTNTIVASMTNEDGTWSDTVAVRVNHVPVAVDDAWSVDEGGQLSQPGIGTWYNVSWKHRQQITFNPPYGGSLTDVPVLIQLHETAADAVQIDYSLTQNAGQDLRFVDPSGNLLAFEIESWDESGYSYVWVRVPTLTAGSAGSIWMYYDNPNATDGQDPSSVWGSNLVTAHFNGNALDSGAYGNNGTATSVSYGTGVTGSGAGFDGANSEVRIPAGTTVNNLFDGGATVSVWVNPSSWGENGYGRILDKASGTFSLSNASGWNIEVGGSGSSGYVSLEYGFTGGKQAWVTATGSLRLNQWQHIVISYDSSASTNDPVIFINGVQQAVSQTNSASGSARNDSANDLTIGNFAGGAIRTFGGMMDELRISDGMWTTERVLAEYRMYQGITTGGTVETGPAGLLANDLDFESGALTVSLVSGPSHALQLVLNPDGSFTYQHDESETLSDSFVYAITDQDGGVSTATVHLTIRPVNDAPTGINLSNATVPENSAGATVGTLSTVDADSGDSFTYTVSDSRFEVVGNTLKLRSTSPLDFETTPTIPVVVTSTDSGGLSTQRTVTLTVVNSNDAPTSISLTGGTIAENSVAGTVVGLATASDPDSGDTHTWQIIGGNVGNAFAINSSTGQLTVLTPAALDFEKSQTVSVQLEATDRAGAAVSRVIVVTIQDVNELTRVAGTATLNTAEDSVGVTYSSAGWFIDPDAGDVLRYSLGAISGKPLSSVQVDPQSGVVTLSPTANYNGSFSFVVTATDSGGLSLSKTINVTVTPVPDAPTLQPFSLRADFGRSLLITQSMLLSTAVDVDGDALQAKIIGQPELGTLTNNGDGTWSYTAPAGSKTDHITVQVSDGMLFSNPVISTIDVTVYAQAIVNSSTTSSDSQASTESQPQTDTSTATETATNGSTADKSTVTTVTPDRAPGAVRPQQSSSGSDSDNDNKDDAANAGVGLVGILEESESGGITVIAGIEVSTHLDRTVEGGTFRGFNGTDVGYGFGGSSMLPGGHSAGSLALRMPAMVNWFGANGSSWSEMKDMKSQVDGQLNLGRTVVGSVGVVTTGVSVGYLIWAVRGGMLLSGLLAQMPAWRMVDPLLIVDRLEADEEGESIHSLVERQEQELRASDANVAQPEDPLP
ncbi:MAG: DUF2341 domain-containing protein [Planctomycetaceae bacterium]|nr:DUF2341 domain-containing protein [Planctomycetaceae bacterium]